MNPQYCHHLNFAEEIIHDSLLTRHHVTDIIIVSWVSHFLENVTQIEYSMYSLIELADVWSVIEKLAQELLKPTLMMGNQVQINALKYLL